MHRDITTKNLLVLVSSPPEAVLCDFGKAIEAKENAAPDEHEIEFGVPRVYIEFKTEVNRKDAIQQLFESLSMEYGADLKSKGFLIEVKGTQWTILDYHLVLNPDSEKPLCLINNFYDGNGERPTPSRQYKDYDFMDLKSREDSSDLFKALGWIGEQHEAKDLTFMRHNASHLPVSLTVSTLRSLGNGSEEEEEESEKIEEGLQNEYAHLVPLFRGVLWKWKILWK